MSEFQTKLNSVPSGGFLTDRDKDKKPILDVRELGIDFGGLTAVDGFNLMIGRNEITGLIGPNGAGKTTVFNLLTNVYQPTRGSILIDGMPTAGKKTYQVNRMGVARTFQNIRLFGNLSEKTNVVIACNLHSKYHLGDALFRTSRYRSATKETEEKAMEFLKIVGLDDKADELASSLPYGHQRKLEIARAMATDPKLLLLDEPAAGMNADESLELVSFIQNLKRQFPITVLMIEHHMDVVTSLCDACTVLNFGKTLAAGSVEEIKKNPEVIAAYLGGDE